MIKVILGVAALLAGICVIFFVYRRWRQWQRVQTWRQVRGEVVDFRLKVGREGNHGLEFHTPVVEYRYVYEGREFVGRKVTVHDRHLGSVFVEEAQGVLDRISRYPDVYVDPLDPCKAVLVNKLGKPHFDYLLTRVGIGLLLVVAGVAFLTMLPPLPSSM